MTNVFDLSQKIMRHVTDVMIGTATDGGKTYLKDTFGMSQQPNEYYDRGTLWILSGAHAGKVLRITGHMSQKVTFDPLASVLCVQQVETATVAGTVSGSGNATVIVTAAAMPNSPKTVSVAVLNLDSAATVAGKIRTALAADTDVKNFFEVGGSGTDVTLTTKTARANDTTMNISIDNGTCTGLTPALTSAHTTAGVAGPRYAVVKGAFPWEQLLLAIQQAVDETHVTGHDNSLTGDGTTLVFPLPAGVRDIKEVRTEKLSMSGHESISNHWAEELSNLVFDYGFTPVKDDIIHLYWRGEHESITGYETEISTELNEKWLVLEAAKNLLLWGAGMYGKKPDYMIEERINLVMNKMKGMRMRLGGPDIRMKSAGGGREY